MTGYQYRPYTKIDLSVAMEAGVAEALERHFAQHFGGQEDLSFAYWQPSRGMSRYSAILQSVNLPKEDERVLQGNVAFTVEYLSRTLRERPKDCGVALIHSHLGPGWQGMSHDDVVAERDRLAGVVESVVAGSPLDRPLVVEKKGRRSFGEQCPLNSQLGLPTSRPRLMA